MILILCTGFLFSQTAIAPAGSGTSEDPYEIATWQNLYWITQNSTEWNKYYIQTENIDLNDAVPTINTWDSGAGWTQIGSPNEVSPFTPFTGSYDGQNHSINGIYINRPSTDYIGMFGYTENSSIINLKLLSVYVNARYYIGGLVGYHCFGSVIQNCSVSGTVISEAIGGIISGSNYNSNINTSYSDGTITTSGNGSAGGLVGYNRSNFGVQSSINNCYSMATVNGGNLYSGGLVGYNYSSTSPSNMCTITNSYSTGTVTGSTDIGGLVGWNYNSLSVNNCFWDASTSGQITSAGGVGKTTEEMKILSTFTDVGWDFTETWGMDPNINEGYPFLKSLTDIISPQVFSISVTDTLIHNALITYSISSLGGADSVHHGVCWNTTGNPDLSDNVSTALTATDTATYSYLMGNLQPDTQYYVRAYAINSAETAYGEVLSYTTSPEAELVAYWTFDHDNGNDITGNHNGTIVGSDVSFAAGMVGNAVKFTGSGTSYIEIPSFNLPYITVEAWVNSAKYGYYTSMVTKNYYSYGWSSPYVVWQLWLAENTAFPSATGLYSWGATSPESISMNNWYHMAFVYDGVSVTLYINGEEKAKTELSIREFPETDGNIYIGKPLTSNHSFIGMIDEVAIWDNALDPEKILEHYQNGLIGLPYLKTEPSVSTVSVSDTLIHHALVTYSIDDLGGGDSVSHGVCWNTSGNPTISDFVSLDSTSTDTGTFIYLIDNLQANTQYYVRAYASNAFSTVYGEVLSFTTLPKAELVAYWTFDHDNGNDITGNHNGTVVGSDVSFTEGMVRQAVHFGGSGLSYIEIPSFNLPHLTAEMWVNSEKYGYYTSMLCKNYYTSGWTTPYTVWQLWLENSTPRPGAYGLYGYGWAIFSPESVPMNTWFHMAFTYDGVLLRLYVNGIEKAYSETDIREFPEAPGNVYIGRAKDANHTFLGMIDEVAIWDNALDADEILEHYLNSLNDQHYIPLEPVISTIATDEITTNSAVCTADISSLGMSSLTAHGICWSTDSLPTILDNKTDEGARDSIGEFSSQLTGLTNNTRYFVRAYATNSLGTAYGEALVFSTLELSWKMQITANMLTYEDNENYLGVIHDATNDFDTLYDEIKPPVPPGDYVQLYFPHPEYGIPLGDNFSKDICQDIALSDTMQIWNFEVLSTQTKPVTLTFDFTRIPDVPVILEDKATSNKQVLCSGDSYVYTAEANITRLFSISIGDTTAPVLSIGTEFNGPAIYHAGDVLTLNWSASDGNGVDISELWMSEDNGDNYVLLASPEDEEYYDWTLPDTNLIQQTMLRMRIFDYAGNSAEATSTHSFAIAGDSLSTTVCSGWNLWGSPLAIDDPDISTCLDDDFSSYYVVYEYEYQGYLFSNDITTARGYWLGTMEETIIDIAGFPLTSEYMISLSNGWNLISDPLVLPVSVDSLCFTQNGTNKLYTEAVAAGWIDNIYMYNDESGYQYATQIDPWKGYWLGVLQENISVTFPIHKNPPITLHKTSIENSPLIAFHAEAGNMNHDLLAIGTHDNAGSGFDPEFDAITPPIPPGSEYLSVYVPRIDLTDLVLGNHFSKDIRSTIDGENIEEWIIEVQTNETSASVIWSIENIPDNLEIGIDIQGLGYFENMRDIEYTTVQQGQSFRVRLGTHVLGTAINTIPETYALGDNYPNPFNPTTMIRYTLPETALVKLIVYDISGRIVRTLVDSEQAAGYQSVVWDGCNDAGQYVSSGLYIYQIKANNFIASNKMVLMK
jgi:hypothetical protein